MLKLLYGKVNNHKILMKNRRKSNENSMNDQLKNLKLKLTL